MLNVALMAERLTRRELRCSMLKAVRSLGCIAPDTSCACMGTSMGGAGHKTHVHKLVRGIACQYYE